MVDFKTSRKKNLDLVIARPATEVKVRRKLDTLADVGRSIGVVLTDRMAWMSIIVGGVIAAAGLFTGRTWTSRRVRSGVGHVR